MNKHKQQENLSKMLLWFILAVFVFLGGFFLGRLDLDKRKSQKPDYVITGEVKSTHNEVNVNLLWEVWDKVEQYYIEEDIDGQALLYGAARGLVEGLDDPYTSFLTPEETAQYYASNKGEFQGIGASLRQENDYVAVESPISKSPAEMAGLKPGDIIIAVNDEDMAGLSVYTVAEKIRGEEGTIVKIALYRPSTEEYFEVEITRAKIDQDNIVVEFTEDNIAHIKINKFTEESVEIFKQQWDTMLEQILARDELKGVIVDLRNNPGGYVEAVEYVLNEFFPKNTVIFKEQTKNSKPVEYKVKRTGKLQEVYLVVIVNEGSVSASEIFAGAVQDNERGNVIGQPTAGKGLEQQLFKLSDGSTLQLVFQKWLTPDGRNINPEDPIKPDILVEGYEEQTNKAIELILNAD